jgi:dihydropteroate synthase
LVYNAHYPPEIPTVMHFQHQHRSYTFDWRSRTYVMGILNVTPDSFSDGGLYDNVSAAIVQATHMRDHGADILDIGGQSTKPNAEEVILEQELKRVIPIITALRTDPSFDRVAISIDTTKAAVARADLINDISGATFDSDMLPTVAKLGVPIVLMHLRGTPKTMQQMTIYQDLIGEVIEFLRDRMAAATAIGIPSEHLIIDPGIGFAKTPEQNLELLREIEKLQILNAPILIGTSRKSFIGKILNQPDATQRVWGTAATCSAAIAQGADILRVHDVAEMSDVIRVSDAIWRSGNR